MQENNKNFSEKGLTEKKDSSETIPPKSENKDEKNIEYEDPGKSDSTGRLNIPPDSGDEKDQDSPLRDSGTEENEPVIEEEISGNEEEKEPAKSIDGNTDYKEPAPEDTTIKEEEESEKDEEEKPGRIYWIPAVIVSFILSLIPAWNIPSRLRTHYLGGGELEGWLWRYWWFKELMASLLAQTPKNWGLIIYTYFCAGNYPETGNVFDWQTFSLILEPVFGDPAYYNIKIILILFLNGIAGYALAKYLTKKPVLSLIGSVVLILNPYVVYEIVNGRPRQAMLFSMPLFAMYLIDNYRTLSLKSGLLAGFWLGISAAVYLYYGMASLFFGLIFILVQLYIDHRKFTFTFVKYIVVILVIFVLISGLFSFRYIEIVLKKEQLPEVSYHKDFPPLDFLLQKDVEVAPRDSLGQSILRYKSDSAPVFYPFRLGYMINIPIVISLIALVAIIFVRPVPWLWLVTFLFFYILTLGPYLRFGYGEDNYVRIASGRPIPLLYAAFFKYVPFFARLFAPIRMMGMMYVAVCALSAINLKFLMDKLREKSGRIRKVDFRITGGIVLLLIVSAIVIQMVVIDQIPIFVTERVYPEIYDEIAKEKGQFGVIELPFRVGDFGNYYQMYHGKKVLWGWTYGSIPLGFPPSKAKYLSTVDSIEANTYVKYLEELNRQPTKTPPFREQDMKKLGKMGYKYVILHERGCDELDPGHGESAYNYFIEQLTKSLGEPVKIGIEKWNWQLLDNYKTKQLYKIAVFKIPEPEKKK